MTERRKIMHLTAHSGSSGTRMNSKEYLEKALYEPVDFIEIDVRKNHDGALILSHNPDGDGVPVVSLKDAFCILHHSVKNINCDCKQYQLGPEILYMAEKADIESERIFFSGSMKPDFSEEEAITFDVSAKQIFINAEELFLILDEAQNATPKQVMGIVTRAGEKTKIVICGDPDQIDDVMLDRKNNGLVFAAETMKDSQYCAIVTFKESECVRSELARAAAERMRDIA
jgi:glycerophosphoryl diester phosphodiesterase